MKKILIIGAGFLQDFVIQKAVAMGYETHAVDSNPNAVGFKSAHKHAVIDIVDQEGCLKYAQDNNIDGVLTAATDYGVLTASYIAKEMGLVGIDYEVAKVIKNKYLVRKCLFDASVDDTDQAFEVNADTDISELSKQVRYPVMVKPCDGSGSRGTSRVDKAEDLEEACKFAMDGSITHRAEIETFIDGKEYGAETLVIDGEPHVFSLMKKWITEPPYYSELGHAIPDDLSDDVREKATNCVKDAIKALGVNAGSINIDMLITKEGKVYIIDIGARMGGNMIGPCIIPYGTGIDYMAAMISYAAGDDFDLSAQEHGAVATRLLAFEEGDVKKLPNIKEIEEQYDVEIYHHMTDGMHVNKYRTNLDGCGYIIAKADSMEEASRRAEEVLQYFKDTVF